MDYLANSWIGFSWQYLLACKNDGYDESGALVVAEQWVVGLRINKNQIRKQAKVCGNQEATRLRLSDQSIMVII